MTRVLIKRILMMLAGVGLVGLLVWALWPEPVAVELATVRHEAFEQTIDKDGKTRVRERYVGSAPLAGRVQRLTLKAGDVVQAGVVVAVEQAELAATINRKELDTARFDEHATEHEVTQAQAALQRVGTTQTGAEQAWQIRSPVRGNVLRVLQESEAVVALETPLLEIGQAENLEVVVDVLTTEAVQIHPSATVWLERWGQDQRVLEGRVRRVEPGAFTKVSALGIEEQRTNVIIDIVSPPEQWHTLGDGYKVHARIVVFRQDAAVTVPVGAVFREGERRAVFVIRNGVAQKRRIETPRRNSQDALVTSGLAPGEQVIVYPSQAVEDGVRGELR
jgi:HlyD family secretion protein